MKTHFDLRSWQQYQAYSNESKKLKLDEISSDQQQTTTTTEHFWNNPSASHQIDYMTESPLQPSNEAQARVEAEEEKKNYLKSIEGSGIDSLVENKKTVIRLTPSFHEKKVVFVTPMTENQHIKVPRKHHKKRSLCLTSEQVLIVQKVLDKSHR